MMDLSRGGRHAALRRREQAVRRGRGGTGRAELTTLFPLTAPLVSPARSALVGVPLWEHAVAVLIVLITIYAAIRIVGRSYEAGLLRSGPALALRAAIRLARHP
jgi:hypothetical protein